MSDAKEYIAKKNRLYQAAKAVVGSIQARRPLKVGETVEVSWNTGMRETVRERDSLTGRFKTVARPVMQTGKVRITKAIANDAMRMLKRDQVENFVFWSALGGPKCLGL